MKKDTTISIKKSTLYLIFFIFMILFFGWYKGIIQLPDLSYFTEFSIVSTDTSESLINTEASDECRIQSDKTRYCIGDWATVTLNGEANTLYSIYINKDNAGYSLWGRRATDFNGFAEQAGYVNVPGDYQIRAMSPTCYSNVLDVDVVNCAPQTDDCWWQSIAKEDLTLSPYLFVNWHGVLVDGNFKYAWDYERTGIDTEISHDATLVHTSANRVGEYQFTATNGQTWQISALNDLALSSDVHFELYQWICQGDSLNWNPNMLGSMGQLDSGCQQDVIELVHGGYAGATDDMGFTPDNVISVSQLGNEYPIGSYVWSGSMIDWSPAGAEPTPGSSYEVLYEIC